MQISRATYDQHVYTLRTAHRLYGVVGSRIEETFPTFEALTTLSVEEVLAQGAVASRRRLSMISSSIAAQILPEPRLRRMVFDEISFLLPLMNDQGVEWYGSAPNSAFDFLAERRLGLLDGAQTIYDFGGHQGVWAAYYSKLQGGACRILSFEPMILNVEVSALQFLINDICNVVTVAAAVGTSHHPNVGWSEANAGMLVDFVDGHFPVMDVQALAWAHAGFVKLDVEGFEYDLLTSHPWLFQLGRNMHLELHIPHLDYRGLDYRNVLAVLPFDEFDVFNTASGHEEMVYRDTPLSGYCSLMLRRR